MENSISEVEPHQSFRLPPRRRRSTFFERRDSIVPTTITPNDISLQNETDGKERHTEDLTRYYEKLLIEKQLWMKEAKERRNKYHDLREQYHLAVKAPSHSSMSYAALSNEDIEYLNAKPNISRFIHSQQKLHNSVMETKALFRRLNELDNVVLTRSEEVVEKITDYILENSTAEPIE